MRAKSGYKQQKSNPEHWDERRQAYTTVGRHLHRYFLLRTTRHKNGESDEEADLRCDGTCPFCMPPEDLRKEPNG